LDLSKDHSSLYLARIILEGLGLPDADGIDFMKILEMGIAKMNENQ
jgi:hypothetical protein